MAPSPAEYILLGQQPETKPEPEPEPEPKPNYRNLPCPVPYEDYSQEATISLKPEVFEGMQFDFNKPLNTKFSLSHSLLMGPM